MGYILVIDDDPDYTGAIAIVLRKEGHEVDICNDTENALECLDKKSPDLVILDVMFPENATGGFDFARKIAQFHKGIPILMLTAVNSHFQLDFSAQDIDQDWMPVTDFMEKPVDFDLMVKTVKQLIDNNSLHTSA